MIETPRPSALSLAAVRPVQVQVISTDGQRPLRERVQVTEVLRAPLAAGQVRIGMLAMAINPADLLQMEGRYGVQPQLPYVPGHEGVAVVLEVASDIADLAPGDRVLPMGSGGWWADERIVSRRQLVPVSGNSDVLQCAMLTANPATAWVLLRHMCTLQRGDWVVQNAANSALGQCVRQLATPLGLRVLNLVRRADAVGQADTADSAWIVDTAADLPLLRAKVEQATQGAAVPLALDAVGGEASQALAQCLSDGATLVVFGLMSGLPCQIAAHDLVFRALQVRGFWLASWFSSADNRSKAKSLYPELVAMVESGALRMDVEAVYPLGQVHEAIAHAARPGRSGKVLLQGDWMKFLNQPLVW